MQAKKDVAETALGDGGTRVMEWLLEASKGPSYPDSSWWTVWSNHPLHLSAGVAGAFLNPSLLNRCKPYWLLLGSLFLPSCIAWSMISISSQSSIPWPLKGCHFIVLIRSDLELFLILNISVVEGLIPDLEPLWIWVMCFSFKLKKYIFWKYWSRVIKSLPWPFILQMPLASTELLWSASFVSFSAQTNKRVMGKSKDSRWEETEEAFGSLCALGFEVRSWKGSPLWQATALCDLHQSGQARSRALGAQGLLQKGGIAQAVGLPCTLCSGKVSHEGLGPSM